MKRKSCKECPWLKQNKTNHNIKWPNYVNKIKSIGKIENGHACHMITSDTWGIKSDINKDNICIGQKINFKTSNLF